MPSHFSRRNLPHWYEDGAACFITYVVAGALAASVRTIYVETKRGYARAVGRALLNDEDLVLIWDRVISRLERYLERTAGADTWVLATPEHAREAYESLLFLHERGELRLLAFCVMSNHVHLVADHFTSAPTTMMGRHKSFVANRINRRRESSGRIFHDECFDHLPRTLAAVIEKCNYTILNPVAAGVVARVSDHPWTWYNEAIFELCDERLVLREDCALVPRGLR